jgi:Raf kinase inhibitor-like YbhB/YbcL family protein
MRLASPAFEYGRRIPVRHTGDGDDLSPPLRLSDLPDGTVTLALVVEDPDVPKATWDHWVAYDIEPVLEIPEGVESLGTPGRNSWRRFGYTGPCPPTGIHRYLFRVYALDRTLGLEDGADKKTLTDAMKGHVVREATLMGRYGR